MPDGQGRYYRSEIRELVRRRLDTLRYVVGVTTGEESTLLQIDPIVTNEDINAFLNTALTRRFIELTLADETLFADVEYIDTVINTTEYELPTDLYALRTLKWKIRQDDSFTLNPPNERVDMWMVDESLGPNVDNRGIPTYRRRLNMIVLNAPPQTSVSGGILVDYIKWILPVMQDDAVIESQFARILQEVIILDVTIEAATTKTKLDTSDLMAMRKPMEEALILAVRNSTMPTSVRMVPGSQTMVTPFRRGSRRVWE